MKNLALPPMGDFREKTIQSGFPTLTQDSWSGARTIWDLPPPSITLKVGVLERVYRQLYLDALRILLYTDLYKNSLLILKTIDNS